VRRNKRGRVRMRGEWKGWEGRDKKEGKGFGGPMSKCFLCPCGPALVPTG